MAGSEKISVDLRGFLKRAAVGAAALVAKPEAAQPQQAQEAEEAAEVRCPPLTTPATRIPRGSPAASRSPVGVAHGYYKIASKPILTTPPQLERCMSTRLKLPLVLLALLVSGVAYGADTAFLIGDFGSDSRYNVSFGVFRQALEARQWSVTTMYRDGTYLPNSLPARADSIGSVCDRILADPQDGQVILYFSTDGYIQRGETSHSLKFGDWDYSLDSVRDCIQESRRRNQKKTFLICDLSCNSGPTQNLFPPGSGVCTVTAATRDSLLIDSYDPAALHDDRQWVFPIQFAKHAAGNGPLSVRELFEKSRKNDISGLNMPQISDFYSPWVGDIGVLLTKTDMTNYLRRHRKHDVTHAGTECPDCETDIPNWAPGLKKRLQNALLANRAAVSDPNLQALGTKMMDLMDNIVFLYGRIESTLAELNPILRGEASADDTTRNRLDQQYSNEYAQLEKDADQFMRAERLYYEKYNEIIGPRDSACQNFNLGHPSRSVSPSSAGK